MPKKVQPYGSGEDAERAALARAGRESPSFVNHLAATLNQLTADARELTGPVEVRGVVGGLALMGQELPQLCEQLARCLVAQREDGRIAQSSAHHPDLVLVEVSDALTAAGRAADMMAAALTEAGTKAADLNAQSR